MFRPIPAVILAAFLSLAVTARAADTYVLDAAHSAVSFQIDHLGLSKTHGRFNDIAGEFTVDADPAKCSFNVTIKVESVDTGNKQRDAHLRNPDFFNAKQFPTLTFKSTKVAKGKNGLDVTGDVTLHGVTKPVTFTLTGGKTMDVRGKKVTGYTTEFTLKRSDFGVGAAGPLGDEVFIDVSFEGAAK